MTMTFDDVCEIANKTATRMKMIVTAITWYPSAPYTYIVGLADDDTSSYFSISEIGEQPFSDYVTEIVENRTKDNEQY